MTHPSRHATFTSTLALALALATACGGGASAEPPLGSITGELRAAGGAATPEAPVRLALAWYPGLLTAAGPLSGPRAITTQDVAYAGDLPLAYGFEVTEPPPASALVPLPGGLPGRGAVGILLAYRDGDGDGRLDPIAEDGAPVDRVLGASLDWGAAPAHLVVYLTDAQPAWTGLSAGMNLLAVLDAETTEVVPLTTAIPIDVSEGGAHLDLFVCEAAWDGSGSQAPCGLDLDGAARAGVGLPLDPQP